MNEYELDEGCVFDASFLDDTTTTAIRKFHKGTDGRYIHESLPANFDETREIADPYWCVDDDI